MLYTLPDGNGIDLLDVREVVFLEEIRAEADGSWHNQPPRLRIASKLRNNSCLYIVPFSTSAQAQAFRTELIKLVNQAHVDQINTMS